MAITTTVLVLVVRHEADAVRPQSACINTTGELIEARPVRKAFATNTTTAPLARALESLNRWIARAS